MMGAVHLGASGLTPRSWTASGDAVIASMVLLSGFESTASERKQAILIDSVSSPNHSPGAHGPMEDGNYFGDNQLLALASTP